MFNFEFKFKISDYVKLEIHEEQIEILNREKIKIILKSSEPSKSIKESDQLQVKGSGFGNEEEALKFGENLISTLILAFAELKFPADFGERAFGYSGLNIYKEGSIFFKGHPVSAEGTIGSNVLLEKFNKRYKEEPDLSLNKRMTFELFSASKFTRYIDAKFILLMMAVEVLINQKDREQKVLDLIDDWVKSVKESNLENKNSLLSSLEQLKKESVGTAGKRLASSLTGKYYGMSSGKFFYYCYDIRSNLIHGNLPRAEFIEVSKLISPLEQFVSDLICSNLNEES